MKHRLNRNTSDKTRAGGLEKWHQYAMTYMDAAEAIETLDPKRARILYFFASDFFKAVGEITESYKCIQLANSMEQYIQEFNMEKWRRGGFDPNPKKRSRNDRKQSRHSNNDKSFSG